MLAESGAIFVSIDDNEVAHLRLLMDEVYGEGNLLAQIVVNLNPKGRQLGRGFATSHEYLLAYAKRRRGRACSTRRAAETVNERDFPLVDGDGRRFRHLPLRNTNKKFNPATARTLHFPVWGSVASGEVRTAPFDDAVEILPVFGDGSPAVWRWSAAADRRAGRGPGLPAWCAAPAASGWTCSRRTGCTRRAAAARSCARSGWPRRWAPPTPPSPS